MCVSGDAAGSCVWTGLDFYGVVHQLGAKKVAVGNHLRGKKETIEEKKEGEPRLAYTYI